MTFDRIPTQLSSLYTIPTIKSTHPQRNTANRKKQSRDRERPSLSALYAPFVSRFSVIDCLRDVLLQIEPRVVRKGEEATLTCTYDLEKAPLYTVKWYRGRHEFYRYTPTENPTRKVFPFGNVKIDVSSRFSWIIMTLFFCFFKFYTRKSVMQAFAQEIWWKSELTPSDVERWIISGTHLEKRNEY